MALSVRQVIHRVRKKRVLTFHTEVPYFGESIKCVSKRLGLSSGSLSLLSNVNKSFYTTGAQGQWSLNLQSQKKNIINTNSSLA